MTPSAGGCEWGRASTWVFLGVAFVLSVKDLSSFIVLAPALRDIAVSDTTVAAQAILLVVLYTFALSPVLALPAMRLVFGRHLGVPPGKRNRPALTSRAIRSTEVVRR